MTRKKGYRSAALVLVLFMVITAVMMQTECEVYAATPVSSHGRLSVKGADLVDKNKKKFQLRGISTHGINWDVGSPYVNKAAFKTLRNDWGVIVQVAASQLFEIRFTKEFSMRQILACT